MTPPISIIGRIATIKMMILPRLNYLFSMIPIQPTAKWFNTLDTTRTSFYWKNKTPRIKLTTLQQSQTQGGLEAPIFLHYYLTNQLQYLRKWIHSTHHYHPWLDIEQTDCQDVSIRALPFISPTIKHRNCFKNPATTLISLLTNHL